MKQNESTKLQELEQYIINEALNSKDLKKLFHRGETYLHRAACAGNLKAIQNLKEKIPVNVKDVSQTTPVRIAIQYNFITALAELFAFPDAKDLNFEGLKEIAIEKNHKHIADLITVKQYMLEIETPSNVTKVINYFFSIITKEEEMTKKELFIAKELFKLLSQEPVKTEQIKNFEEKHKAVLEQTGLGDIYESLFLKPSIVKNTTKHLQKDNYYQTFK